MDFTSFEDLQELLNHEKRGNKKPKRQTATAQSYAPTGLGNGGLNKVTS